MSYENQFTDGSPGSRFLRKMRIARIRNPQDDSQWVDIAVTVGMVTTRRVHDNRSNSPDPEARFVRHLQSFNYLHIGKPEDLSDVFEVRSLDDLKAAAQQFSDEHPD